MRAILGINSHHPGSSASLVVGGTPVAAIAEERLNRRKYYAGFPSLAIAECLRIGGLSITDIDYVAIGRDGSANLGRKLAAVVSRPSKLLNFARMRQKRESLSDLHTLVAEKCGVDRATLKFKPVNVEHHLAHIASAYFCSPWEECAGISIDGSGDFVSSMRARCAGSRIDVTHRVFLPHSLGVLYTMVCQFIGYGKYGDEGKVMGLAPYGTYAYPDFARDVMQTTADGMRLGDDFFVPFGDEAGFEIADDGETTLSRQYSDHMVELFGAPRAPDAEISKRDMDLAHSLQVAFERGYMHLMRLLHTESPSTRVAIAGGCALNSVANGKLFNETPFTETFIQPAAGDEGLSLGAALYTSNVVANEGKRWHMVDSYLGPEYSDDEIEKELERAGIRAQRVDRDTLLSRSAKLIADGMVVGWFQGRMEWGPRALGNRSILAHPGLPNMKEVLNARIKRREWFRPFAPAVLAERQTDLFEHGHPSPFMLHVYTIRPEWRERLCAVTHVDNTGRLQSVARAENPLYYDLIKRFESLTGIPVVLNTSFNENEPVVCHPREAIECFARTKMDALVIGNFVATKTEPV